MDADALNAGFNDKDLISIAHATYTSAQVGLNFNCCVLLRVGGIE